MLTFLNGFLIKALISSQSALAATNYSAQATTMLQFLFSCMAYGGLVIVGIGAIVFVLARKNNNDDLSTNAIWIVLGGLVCALIGFFMGNQTIPTL